VNPHAQGHMMRQIPPRAGRAVIAAGLLLTLAGAVVAADAADKGEAKTVTVTLLGIHATQQKEPHIDPALKPIAEHLKRYRFNSFRLIVQKTQSVGLGRQWELPMLGGHCRRVRPHEAHQDRVKMEVAWVQYVKDKDGKRKARIHERMVMFIGRGKYLLTAVRLKDGALINALAVK